ncbi:isoprenyl transferase [Kitasatospora sp. GP82]|uniref:isoprenyl transferase n=1 Tax=Kitasatospora sp. GP82 TaxID=3035089 RepID=UPI0024748323|nr:isoprenyl transferase [Kitasatospora sp. GP82]
MWVRELAMPVYERRVIKGLEGLPRPRNVGIMLDGNRRWARAAGHSDVAEGYRVGGAKVDEFLTWCTGAEIEHVTLFMLSDDNMGRPEHELIPLLGIIQDTVAGLAEPGRPWRVRVIGSLDLLPAENAAALKEAADRTTGRTGMRVDVAVGYGGRREIVDAVRSAFRQHTADGGDPAELAEVIDVEHISANLYSQGEADRTDLIIRTSGEQRLSGFLLWQSAYAEMHFVDVNWPAFRRVDFLRALRSFAQRERRFGK